LGLPGHGFIPHLVCLRGLGEVGSEISLRGITTHSSISRRRFDPAALFRLTGIMKSDRDALLLTLDHHDAVFLGAWASRIAGVRHRILAVHSTGLWSRGSSFSRSDRMVLRTYERIVALAAIHADYLELQEGIDRERIAVINNGVDPERFKPLESEEARARIRARLGLSIDHFVVTIVAALRPEKNHEMLLHAASLLLSDGTPYTFLIVGEGGEAGKLQALAKELALGEAVRFFGRREDIPEILSVSDVSVLCSHPVVETFPLSILESMASGVPVVATSVGSIPEMIEDETEGILVPSGSIAGLREAISRLERDPARRTAMGSRSRTKVMERFSEERMVRNYAELFRGMIGKDQK
jgi:glycosyltransferase involved in cell wall biosynthesis